MTHTCLPQFSNKRTINSNGMGCSSLAQNILHFDGFIGNFTTCTCPLSNVDGGNESHASLLVSLIKAARHPAGLFAYQKCTSQHTAVSFH